MKLKTKIVIIISLYELKIISLEIATADLLIYERKNQTTGDLIKQVFLVGRNRVLVWGKSS